MVAELAEAVPGAGFERLAAAMPVQPTVAHRPGTPMPGTAHPGVFSLEVEQARRELAFLASPPSYAEAEFAHIPNNPNRRS
jgi:hypothetical protein